MKELYEIAGKLSGLGLVPGPKDLPEIVEVLREYKPKSGCILIEAKWLPGKEEEPGCISAKFRNSGKIECLRAQQLSPRWPVIVSREM